MKCLMLLALLLVPNNSVFAMPGGRWSQSTVTVTATASKVLEERGGRQYLLIVNKGSETIYFRVDRAPGTDEGTPIPAGGSYEPQYPPDNKIYLKSESGTQIVELTEG